MPGPTVLSRARRVAVLSVVGSALLGGLNIAVGVLARSTSAFAVGLELAGDVLASAVVLVGLYVAARPPDENHPYGHGRVETVAGLLVGFILVVGGAGIVYRSFQAAGEPHLPPGVAAVWALAAAIAVRSTTSAVKFRIGTGIGSTSLVADAWNDAVDVLSAAVALAAVVLARVSPDRFLAADHYGGVAVGVAVIVTGLRIVRQASLELADTMPSPALTADLRRSVMAVPGVLAVEKHFARKTGLQYHVDLHIEVDPELTVRASHDIAHEVKRRALAELLWVADVLVHVEPFPSERQRGG